MTKKIGDKKVTGVKSTKETSGVEGTEAVSGVADIKATAGVGGVRRTGTVGVRTTRTMTLAEREELLKLVNEEADKLFADGALPQSRRKAVESAVKMAIDAGLLPEDESGKKKR